MQHIDLDDFAFVDSEQPTISLSWEESVNLACDRLLVEEQRASAAKLLRMRTDISTDSTSSLKYCRGDDVVRNVLHTLDCFQTDTGEPLARSREQRLFHFWWLQAFFPFIYGEHWHAHSERVLKDAPDLFGFPQSLSRVFFEVLCLTPRRYGKTWAVAMFIAAMIYSVAGVVFANFSTGKRASGWVMSDVLHFFKQLPDASTRIIKSNQEQLYIAEFASTTSVAKTGATDDTMGRIAQFNSFPSTVDGKSF